MAVLAAVSCLAYVNAGHKEFFFDAAEGRVANARHAQGIISALACYFRGEWNPDSAVSYLTFPLNVSINRLLGRPDFEVAGFLAFNVLVHAINACLVYLLVRALLRGSRQGDQEPALPAAGHEVWIAFAAALLFAVHPLHASSVVYVLQRRGMMAATFYLLGILAWLRARQPDLQSHQGSPSDNSRARGVSAWPWQRIFALAAVPVCIWLSFRSKSMGLTLPVALLAIEFCLRASKRDALRRYLIWMAAGLALSFAAMLVFLSRGGWFDWTRLTIKRFDPVGWGAGTHLLTESRVFLHYWKLLLLPLPRWMSIDHDFELSRTLLEHGALAAMLLHAGLLAAALWGALRGYTLAAAGVLWFYIALLPYSVLPEADLMVEYKTYLPSIGLFLLVAELLSRSAAWGGHTRPSRVPPTKRALWVQAPLVVALAACLLATTLGRNQVYKTPLSLWADAAAKSPGKARPHYNLGNALSDLGRHNEALTEYQEAARLDPAMPLVHNNLGVAYMRLQRWNEAVAALTTAVKLDPGNADAHNNLGVALAEIGRREEAIAHHRRSLELQPAMDSARRNLVLALCEVGRVEEAEAEGLKFGGDAGMARAWMADFLQPTAADLLQQNRPADALPHLELLLRVRPDGSAYYMHGNAQLLLGRTQEAIESFENSVRLVPNFAAGFTNLGIALSMANRHEEAEAALLKALEIDPNYARARAALQQLDASPGAIAP